MVDLKDRVISTFFNNDCAGVRDLSVCPRRTIGDNDFHVLTTCAEIIMMKEKVIVILK